jgi:hypothetical protein
LSLQAVSKGLPVLYADSGGIKELVYSGVGIPDIKTHSFENNIPILSFKTKRFFYGKKG